MNKTIKDIIKEDFKKHAEGKEKEIKEKIKKYPKKLNETEKKNYTLNILKKGNRFKELNQEEKYNIVKKIL